MQVKEMLQIKKVLPLLKRFVKKLRKREEERDFPIDFVKYTIHAKQRLGIHFD
jgi:hypothetical protein